MKIKDQEKYNHKAIEKKWQESWEKNGIYSPNIAEAKKPFYNLMMFPYPSAEGLHVGNMYAFTGADVYGRFKRMQGNDVFEPIGLDGFGIHSENYALKIGRHPLAQAEISEKNFYRQLRSIGNGFDFKRTIETYDPEYYKWTQWLFIQLFKAGLAYRKKAEVNWCPSCKTVLSDEQVIAGECERCGSKVEKRELEQWFFRITKYAQRLLDNIEKLDWTEKVKIAQRNWIGRSEGAEVEFKIEDSELEIKVFTTRPDTLYGATFLVVSPEHQLAQQVANGQRPMVNGKEVRKYVDEAKNKTDIERTAEGKEKTGVFSGLYAINPVNGRKIPVWVADYVLFSYGTGAIMAVPAHDQRDFEFANKYNLEIIPVIKEKDKDLIDVKMDQALSGEGIIIGSDNWNNFHTPQDMGKVIDDLELRSIGKRTINYHLRDWLISRQRYWGPPIPMVFCPNCKESGKSWFTEFEKEERDTGGSIGISNFKFQISNDDAWDASGWYPVPEKDLPVKLPEVEDWKPLGTGKAPLANHPEFYKTQCPACGSDATRETDVSDTFLDSAWYFLRYPNTDIEKEAFDTDRVEKWLPVDMYIGGAEHSVLHLLYSRFITMVLCDLKYLDFDEPFSHFFAHGLIIKDGAKMSKSKGNVVVPDEYISKYGADSLRSYLMFLGPYSDGGDFSDSGIEGMHRFLKRVWRLFSEADKLNTRDGSSKEVGELERMMHKTIKGVTEDIQNFKYNTAIAKLMEYYNALNAFYTTHQSLPTNHCKNFLLLLAPFAPHMTEELWQRLMIKDEGLKNNENKDYQSIHTQSWPEYDASLIESDDVIIVIQVNGKRRGEMEVQRSKIKDQKGIEDKAQEEIEKYLEGTEIKKVIYIPGKIINFVV